MTDGLSPKTRCRCGTYVARNARRTHARRECTARERPKRTVKPEYSPRRCERAACAAVYRPKSSKQRYCSRECWILVAPERERKMVRTSTEPTAAEVAHEAVSAKDSDMRARWVVSGWALEQRRIPAWNAWVECLGLPQHFKEAA